MEVVIVSGSLLKRSGFIVVRNTTILIPVIGCADVLPPDHAWHKREGNLATVGCKHENKTWHLKCVESEWDGVVGSCKATGKTILMVNENGTILLFM